MSTMRTFGTMVVAAALVAALAGGAVAQPWVDGLRSGDRALAQGRVEEATAAYRTSDDGRTVAIDVAGRLALSAWLRGDCAAQAQGAVTDLANAGDALGRVRLEVRLSYLALVQGQHRDVLDRSARALDGLVAAGASPYDRGALLVVRAFAAFATGDAAAGATAHAESLELQAKRVVADPLEIAMRQANHGFAALAEREPAEALRNFDLALRYVARNLAADHPFVVVIERGRAAALAACGKQAASRQAAARADRLAKTAPVCKARKSTFKAP